MSIDILGKLARGEKLTEYEVGYARDRNIKLPSDSKGKRNKPAKDVAPQADEPAEQDSLEDMTKAQLVSLAEERGHELPKGWTKAEMIENMSQGE